MKRSEINNLIDDSLEFFAYHKFLLPAWAEWSIADWKKNKESCSEIFDNMLGWDITDFGSPDFNKMGLILFTIRNGNFHNKAKYKKTYAEKIMIVREEQITPMHFHWSKAEDIINRGGGNLAIQIYNSTADDTFADTPVTVSIDGISKVITAGATVTLKPGDSIQLENGVYHKFYGEKGTGKICVGEVSTVNDDTCDNRFYDKLPRFAEIEEDVVPKYLLSNEYKKFIFN